MNELTRSNVGKHTVIMAKLSLRWVRILHKCPWPCSSCSFLANIAYCNLVISEIFNYQIFKFDINQPQIPKLAMSMLARHDLKRSNFQHARIKNLESIRKMQMASRRKIKSKHGPNWSFALERTNRKRCSISLYQVAPSTESNYH